MIAKSAVLALVALAPAALAQQPAYGQCGGQGYSGSSACASGYYCYAYNQYYSQCIPGTTTTTTTYTGPVPTPTLLPEWAMCGVMEPYGRQCAPGLICSPFNMRCMLSGAPTTAVPITTTTTTNIRPTTTSTPSCSSESGKVYTTCGSACPASCATYGQPIGCAAVCVAGCFCPSGTVDFNGRCVKPTECPKTTTTTTKAATTTTKATTTTSAPTGFPTTGYGDVPLGGQCNTSEPFTLKCAYPYDCSYFNGRCVEPSRATTKRNGETCLGADLYNRPCNSFYDCVPSTLVCVPYESSGINFKSVGEVCGSEDRHNRPCVQGARCDAGKCVRQ